MKRSRPARRSFGARKHENFVLEAHAVQLVMCFDDGSRHGIDAAPAGNRFTSHQSFALRAAAYDSASMQNDLSRRDLFGQDTHRNSPDHRPVSAARMQSSVEPNHASIPMIAGR